MKKEGKRGGESAIVDRIYRRAKEVGISRPKLTEIVGVAQNTFANWASRGTMPPADTALKIADQLQCSVRWLITGKNDKQEEYTIEEKNLVGKFRMLDDQGQFEVKTLLDAKLTVITNAEAAGMVKKYAAG